MKLFNVLTVFFLSIVTTTVFAGKSGKAIESAFPTAEVKSTLNETSPKVREQKFNDYFAAKLPFKISPNETLMSVKLQEDDITFKLAFKPKYLSRFNEDDLGDLFGYENNELNYYYCKLISGTKAMNPKMRYSTYIYETRKGTIEQASESTFNPSVDCAYYMDPANGFVK